VGAYSTPPDSLAGFEGGAGKRRGKEEGRRGKGKEGRKKGKGRGEGREKMGRGKGWPPKRQAWIRH